MAATASLTWLAPVAAGWPPVAIVLLMGSCSGCASPDEADTRAAAAMYQIALSADDYPRVSRIGNTEYSRHSHRRVFERLRSLREPESRTDDDAVPGGGPTFAGVQPGSEPSKPAKGLPESPGRPHRCSNGSGRECEEIDPQSPPIHTERLPGQLPAPAVQGGRR